MQLQSSYHIRAWGRLTSSSGVMSTAASTDWASWS